MVGDIERVLKALEDAAVGYIVVGGVAMVLHGHLRTTADLDLVIHLERENVVRAIDALKRLRYRPRAPVAIEELADQASREKWIREKGLTVFSLWSPENPALEVDVFVEEPFDFRVVRDRAVRVRLESTEVTVISLRDLIDLKRRAGRPRDLEDVEALESIDSGGKTRADG
jgi:predicted nucleotidyltransferase